MEKLTIKDVLVQKPPEMTAEDIKRLRKDLGITQKELANAMGASIKAIQALEQKKYRAKGAILRLLQIFKEHPDIIGK
jgi:putative transcriptional regulator